MSSHYEAGQVPRIRVGPDTLETLPEELETLAVDSVLLLADPSLASSGLVQRLSTHLGRQLTLETMLLPAGEPTTASVDAVATSLRRLRRPALIGLGGGSTLDTAKLAAAVAGGPRPSAEYLLALHALPARLPLLAAPTTAGTGSEVTRTVLLTDPTGRQCGIRGDALLPDAVILDPVASTTLPAPLTASTGLDALVHAVEAVTGQRRNNLLAAPALQAITLVAQHLATAVSDPTDLAARQGMLEAACLAGQAIDHGGTGIAHHIGQALGSLYRLPHGLAVSLGLLAALEWNLEHHPGAYQAPARAMDPLARREDFPALYGRLLAQVGFADCLPDPGPHHPDAVTLAERMVAAENQTMARNNLRPPTPADFPVLARHTLDCWQRLSKEAA